MLDMVCYTGIGKSTNPRFRENEVKKLHSSACCRLENANFYPLILKIGVYGFADPGPLCAPRGRVKHGFLLGFCKILIQYILQREGPRWRRGHPGAAGERQEGEDDARARHRPHRAADGGRTVVASAGPLVSAASDGPVWGRSET